MKETISSADLSSVLPEDVEKEVREGAEISMGTEISEEDMINISHLCDQVGDTAVDIIVLMND